MIGIDEVGRGCLAGPVHVGGVCFSPGSNQEELAKLGINDSKLCTAKKRELLVPEIHDRACAYHVASSSCRDINDKGIIWAIEDAAVRVVREIVKKLPSGTSYVVFTDTLPVRRFVREAIPQHAIFQGDRHSLTVAAASILAKVERDAHMQQLHPAFPHYAWNENKGYATALHREAIRQHGPSEHHRSLYLRKLLQTAV